MPLVDARAFCSSASRFAPRGSAFAATAALRAPVHPRRDVEAFALVEARFIRFTVRCTNRGEPCLDELKIYTTDEKAGNVALPASSAPTTASGSLPGYAIHQLEGLSDGRHGTFT